MRIGYGRVSTRDQNPNGQHDALTAAGCDEIFVDKKSGKLASRPELDKALLMARRGDALVITRLNRLGNSLRNLLDLTAQLDERGVDLVVLEQGIDTTTPAGRLSFHVLAAVAQFQRELIVENTLDGLAAARARGRTGGQKPKLGPKQAQLAQAMYDEVGADGKRRYTVQQIADELRVSRPTIYRYLGREARRVAGAST